MKRRTFLASLIGLCLAPLVKVKPAVSPPVLRGYAFCGETLWQHTLIFGKRNSTDDVDLAAATLISDSRACHPGAMRTIQRDMYVKHDLVYKGMTTARLR